MSEEPTPDDGTELEDEAQDVSDESFVDLTEDLAERTLARLKREVTLPEVPVSPRRLAATLGAVHSKVLAATVTLYVIAVAAGMVIVLRAGLVDWYMHAAMYGVVFSFLVIYVRAHHGQRRVSRGFYAVVSVLLMAFFAYVLHDLIDAREVMAKGKLVQREGLPYLAIPAILLIGAGLGLSFHWLALSGRTAEKPS